MLHWKQLFEKVVPIMVYGVRFIRQTFVAIRFMACFFFR